MGLASVRRDWLTAFVASLTAYCLLPTAAGVLLSLVVMQGTAALNMSLQGVLRNLPAAWYFIQTVREWPRTVFLRVFFVAPEAEKGVREEATK